MDQLLNNMEPYFHRPRQTPKNLCFSAPIFRGLPNLKNPRKKLFTDDYNTRELNYILLKNK